MKFKLVVVVTAILVIALAEPSHSKSTKSNRNFEEAALARHNSHRKKHGSPPLQLDTELNRAAKEWAVHLSQRDVMTHSHDGKTGENLYMTSKPVTAITGEEVVDVWYDEIKKYTDYNKDPLVTGSPPFADIGHFTQVVWKGSKKLGVAMATSRSGNTYVVAKYSPPGNFKGQFVANVLPPGSQRSRNDNKTG